MRKILIIFIFGLTSVPLAAQPLEEYLREAAANNPQLRASFNDYLAAVERTPQAGSLPDPQLTFGYFAKPMETLMGNQRAELSLMQMFPWFGMLRAQKDESSKMAMARYETFREAKNQLFYEIKETWYQLYLLDAQIRLQEENLEIMRSLERIALVKFSSGGTAIPEGSSSGRRNMNTPDAAQSGSGMSGMNGMNQPEATTARPSSGGMGQMQGAGMGSGGGMADVLRAQMEIKELENRIALLHDSRAPLIADFNRLLNRPVETPVSAPDTLLVRDLPADRLALLDSVMTNNPMIKMYQAEQLAFGAKRKMAEKEGYPMIGAGLNYMIFSPQNSGEPGMSMGGGDMIMPMVSVTIPIFRKKYNAKVKEADLQEKAAEFREHAAKNQLVSQWKEALKTLDDAERRIRLYEEQQELAGQTIRLLTTAYSADGSDFEEVLTVQTQLNNYKLQAVEATVDQNIAAAWVEMLSASGLGE